MSIALEIIDSKTTMLELRSRQRSLLADKLLDFANVGAGAVVFGQFVTERPFSSQLAFLGLAIWAALFVFSVALEGRSRP
jgi:hypothetical protein